MVAPYWYGDFLGNSFWFPSLGERQKMRKFFLYGLFSFCFLLVACTETGKWTAFVYPDIDNIPNAGDVQNYIIGEFDTFEECQATAISRLEYIYRTTRKQGDFECGYKCSVRDEYGGLFICKEDRK
jgi:hypothetical protein